MFAIGPAGGSSLYDNKLRWLWARVARSLSSGRPEAGPVGLPGTTGDGISLRQFRGRGFARAPLGITRCARQSTTILTRSRALTWAWASRPLRTRKRSVG